MKAKTRQSIRKSIRSFNGSLSLLSYNGNDSSLSLLSNDDSVQDHNCIDSSAKPPSRLAKTVSGSIRRTSQVFSKPKVKAITHIGELDQDAVRKKAEFIAAKQAEFKAAAKLVAERVEARALEETKKAEAEAESSDDSKKAPKSKKAIDAESSDDSKKTPTIRKLKEEDGTRRKQRRGSGRDAKTGDGTRRKRRTSSPTRRSRSNPRVPTTSGRAKPRPILKKAASCRIPKQDITKNKRRSSGRELDSNRNGPTKQDRVSRRADRTTKRIAARNVGAETLTPRMRLARAASESALMIDISSCDEDPLISSKSTRGQKRDADKPRHSNSRRAALRKLGSTMALIQEDPLRGSNSTRGQKKEEANLQSSNSHHAALRKAGSARCVVNDEDKLRHSNSRRAGLQKAVSSRVVITGQTGASRRLSRTHRASSLRNLQISMTQLQQLETHQKEKEADPNAGRSRKETALHQIKMEFDDTKNRKEDASKRGPARLHSLFREDSIKIKPSLVSASPSTTSYLPGSLAGSASSLSMIGGPILASPATKDEVAAAGPHTDLDESLLENLAQNSAWAPTA